MKFRKSVLILVMALLGSSLPQAGELPPNVMRFEIVHDLDEEFSIVLQSAKATKTQNIITGYLENVGTDTYENVVIHCKYLSEDGEEILTRDEVVAEGEAIAPGEQREFQVEVERQEAIVSVEVTCLSADLVEEPLEPEPKQPTGTEDNRFENLQISIEEEPWRVTRPYTICKYYRKTLTALPQDFVYLLVQDKQTFDVTKEGKIELFASIYDDDIDDYERNQYDYTIDAAFVFDDRPAGLEGLAISIDGVSQESSLPEYYDFKVSCTDAKNRSGVVAYESSLKGSDESVTWYFVLRNGIGTFSFSKKCETPPSAEDAQIRLLGTLFFEGEIEEHPLSLGEYTYEIDEGYSYSSCQGTQEVLGSDHENGLALVRVSEEGENDRNRLVYLHDGVGTIFTYNPDMDSSNQDLYSFEIIDFMSCDYPLDYEYHISGKEPCTPISIEEIADSLRSLSCVEFGDGWFTFDSNAGDSPYADDSFWLPYLPKILDMTGFPTSVYWKMVLTTSVEGTKEVSADAYTVSWHYGPECGLEALFKVK